MKRVALVFTGVFYVECAQGQLQTSAVVPVYLNFNSHNETTDTNYLTVGTWCSHRALVKQIVDLVVANNARYDAQHDTLFISKAQALDSGCADYAGQTIIQYQASKSQVQIDAHSHEALDNYADVVLALQNAGGNPSKVVGGFTYDQVSGTTTDWELMQSALAGRNNPSFNYTFDYLWGAGSANHTSDDNSYGYWKPKSKAEFTTHDASKRLTYIGNGCSAVIPATASSAQVQGNADSVVAVMKRIINYAATRTGANGEFFTQTIQMDHKNMTSDYVSVLSNIMDQLQPYVNSGQIVYATLNEKTAAWKKYGARNFRLPCASVPN